jgi:NADH-quinone oxidoreductase subunit J
VVYVDISMLVAMVCVGLWAVMTRSMLRAAIALALASALVAVLMFKLSSPLAAVFELSVCSGLISVLFISTISLASPETKSEKAEHCKARFQRFRYLPVVIVLLAIVLSFMAVKLNVSPRINIEGVIDARTIMWDTRTVDILGQVVSLLAGVFGVVILFKEADKK